MVGKGGRGCKGGVGKKCGGMRGGMRGRGGGKRCRMGGGRGGKMVSGGKGGEGGMETLLKAGYEDNKSGGAMMENAIEIAGKPTHSKRAAWLRYKGDSFPAFEREAEILISIIDNGHILDLRDRLADYLTIIYNMRHLEDSKKVKTRDDEKPAERSGFNANKLLRKE